MANGKPENFRMYHTLKFRGMKTTHLTLIAIALLVGLTSLHAQTINCDSFTVIGIEPDSFNVDNSLINIQMAGDFSAFANYPYISTVTDCNGDTLSSGGGLTFFGQMGGTTQGYPVSLIDDNVCLPISIEFIYGNDLNEIDTCLLSFGGADLCNLFTITGIEADSLNPGNTLINIQMDGDPFDQINYPLVTAITDCNGDTVATGELFFFGQLGQTTQSYPVTALGSNLCFPITVHFFYGVDDIFPDGETCLLTFNGSSLNTQEILPSLVSVYPNPARSEIHVSTSSGKTNQSYFLYNAAGNLIESGQLASSITRINMNSLSEGIYILRVGHEVVKVVKE